MTLRRMRFWLGGLVVLLAVVALGPAGAASGAEHGVSACNPDGRLFCIDVNTFSGITASDPTRTDGDRYTWVEWKVRNTGGTTLTHPETTTTRTDYCDTDDDPDTAPEVCEEQTSAFVESSVPSGCTLDEGAVGCSYPNMSGGGSTGPFTRVYFKTADLPAVQTVITVTATVNERASDANVCADGDPNCDVFSTPITNSYEPDLNAGYTFALTGRDFHIQTNDGLTSFDFTSNHPTPFLAQLKTLAHSSTTSLCFGTIPCFERALDVDTSGATGFSATNVVVFYARLSTAGVSSVNQNNLSAIHYYSPIAFTISGNRLTPVNGMSFARMDGLRIGTTKYFVVGYQSGGSLPNSFQISLTQGGSPVAPPDDEGEPIRIIGDQSFERTNSTGCTTSPPSTVPVPSICVQKVQGLQQTFDAWTTDLGNGFIKH